jgi:hypothetical protein
MQQVELSGFYGRSIQTRFREGQAFGARRLEKDW